MLRGRDSIKIGLVGCGGRGSGAAANALSVAPNARLTLMAMHLPTGWKAPGSGNRRQSGIYNNSDELKWQLPAQNQDAEIDTFKEMFAGMQSGSFVKDSLSMGRSTMLALLGRMATHGVQKVTWDDALASNLVLAPERYAWDAPPPVLPRADGTYSH